MQYLLKLRGTQLLPGRRDPRPSVFPAAGLAHCHQAARSPSDGPSAPTHLTSLTTRGLGTFLGTLLEDVARPLCVTASCLEPETFGKLLVFLWTVRF